MKVTPWEGVLTEEGVRRKLEPGGELVTRLLFAPGAKAKASALERKAIVLEGQCRVSARGKTAVLSRGDCVLLPEGPYELEVLSAQQVELLIAFRLPAAVLERVQRRS